MIGFGLGVGDGQPLFSVEVANVDIDAASASAKFPSYNNRTTDAADQAWFEQPAKNHASFSNVFADGQAAYAIVRLPKPERTWQVTNAVDGVFGSSEVYSKHFLLRYYPPNFWNASKRGRFEGLFGEAGGPEVSALSQIWTEDSALVVWSRTGNDFQVDLYSLTDGTRLAGMPVTTSGIATSVSLNYDFLIGGNGTFSDSYNSGRPVQGDYSTNGAYWRGEIKEVGLVSGSPTIVNWQAVALGEDVMPEIGPANGIWVRSWDAATKNFIKPASATSDVSGLTLAGTGEGSDAGARIGLNVLAGSDLCRQSVAKHLTVSGWPEGLVHGLVGTNATADVPFSGVVGGHTGALEVRTVYVATGEVHSNWATVATISGNTWSGTVALPKAASGWLIAQFRATSDPDEITSIMSEFGVGYVIAFLGQSQITIMQDSANQGLTVSNRHTVSFVSDNSGDANIYRIDPRQQSDGLATMINQIRVFDANTPVMIMDMAVAGTGMLDLIDDDRASRNWSDLQAKLEATTNSVSVVVMNWGGNDSAAADISTRLNAMFYGTGADAVAAEHDFTTSLKAGFKIAISPLTRFSDGGFVEAVREDIVAWANTTGTTVGSPNPDFRISDAGGPHQSVTSAKGSPLLGARLAVAAARALGLDTSSNPYFDAGGTVMATNIITIPVVRPNGGVLFSQTPAALTNFQVNGSSAGFVAAISGSNVTLTKDVGNWSPSDIVTYMANGENRTDGDGAAEDRIIDGALYETWADDVLGLGLPVCGMQSVGKWVIGFTATV